MNRAWWIVATSLVLAHGGLPAVADDALDDAPFSGAKYDRFRNDWRAIGMQEAHIALLAGDYEAAVSFFDKVKRFDIQSHVDRAQELSRNGEADRATAEYDLAIQLERNPDNLALLWFNRGCTLQSKGRFDKAAEAYGEAIRLRPHWDTAYSARGVAWYNFGAYDKAIPDLDEAIRLDPHDATSFLSLSCRGLCLAHTGNVKLGIADLDEAIRLNVHDAAAVYYRGLVRHENGDDQRAIIDFEQAVRLAPNNKSMHDTFAKVLATSSNEHVRDGKRAIEIATHACELPPWNDPASLGTLAAAYAANEDFDNAVKWQAKALALRPDDAEFQLTGKKRLELYKQGNPCRVLWLIE
jgi:tetratricopeptide (TPR) repeat protein